MSRLTGIPLTVESAERALTDLMPNRPKLSGLEIINAVAHHYGITLEDIQGRAGADVLLAPAKLQCIY